MTDNDALELLEREIVEKFSQLDSVWRKRVLAKLVLLPSQPNPTWLEEARILREEMRRKYGQLPFSLSDILNEAREERLNDLLDHR